MKKLTALFTFAFFLVFVGWAITPVQADPPRPAHKHGDGGATGVVYCVELIGNGDGAFQWEGCVPVIPDAKETELRFPDNPMVSPQGGAIAPGTDWYDVFTDCDALGPTPVPLDQLELIREGFTEDTVVVSAERLAVFFIGIVYGEPPVDVVVRLRGTHADFQGPILPASGGTSEFILSDAWLDGQTLNKPKAHCSKPRRDSLPLLNPGSTLVITACPTGTDPLGSCTP